MSAATTSPSVNASNANGSVNSTTSPLHTTGPRASLKMSTGRGTDGARKQAGSPVDNNQKKAKAWSQGTNPITQRSSNSVNPSNSPSNGIVNSPKTTPNTQPRLSETASPMAHMSDRMMYLLAKMTGLPSNIKLKNGEKYTGVLSGTSLDPTEMRYVFKMVKRVPEGDAPVNGTNGVPDEYVGVGENHVMSFDIGDVADFNVQNVVLDKSESKVQNGAASNFRTDTDISGSSNAQERPLQRWEPSVETNVDLSLDAPSGEWDQFATNEKLFGVRSNYKEEYYTTTINYSDPQYAEKAARAAKLAKEIEGGNSSNAHIREERGQVQTDDKGLDEEDKYSGVHREFPALRAGAPNRYTPPARRAPTSQPTVPGAPHDPAIISSQIARPDSASKSTQRAVSPVPEKRPTPEPVKSVPAAKTDTVIPTASSTTKDVTEKAESKSIPPVKLATEQVPKPSATVGAAGTLPRKPGRQDNATATVEHDLLDSFKAFSAQEKLRVSERTRTLQRESKAVKLNDLRKFSQNFKLNTPVPQDLVPILAKDETKQQLIVEKARRAVEELKTQPPKPTAAPTDPKAQAARTPASKPESSVPSPSSTVDKQQPQQRRPGQPQFMGSASMRDRSGPNQHQHPHQNSARNTGLLGTRLASNLNSAQHKQQGGIPFNGVPHPIPATPETRPPTGPSAPSSGGQTPTSNASLSRFNVRAHEFRPNPAANTFQPTSNASTQSSPRPESAPKQEPPRKIPITSFFGGDRPSIRPLNLQEEFNIVKGLTNQPHDEKEQRDCNLNGGIPHPYRSMPTWSYQTDRSYIDYFQPTPRQPPITAPQNAMNNNVHMLQHQLPPHLLGPQNGHQNPTPQLTPRHPPAQPHHSQGGHPHFDSQPMSFSHSASGMHSSPRNMPPYMYGGQPQTMPGFPGPVPMQGYGMSPNMQHVGVQRPGGPPFGNNGMGGHVMAQQPSNGPYMGMTGPPPMQMYSPAQGHAYPYANQMSGPPGAGGFGSSPRPGAAPLMHHQGSQQGHQPQPQMFLPHGGGQGPPMYQQQMPPGGMNNMVRYPQHQPHYGSPHQHPQFPQNHRGTPSGSYAQPMVQQHSMQSQGHPPTGPASHVQDGGDEAK